MVRYPHVMTWEMPDGESQIDPATGYPMPGATGATVVTDCRFHTTSSKMLRNQDSIEILQVGKIRIPLGSVVPHLWANVVVTSGANAVYSGSCKNRFEGQLV